MPVFKEEELTRNIIGVAMKVHNALGPGFKENIYHKALIVALEKSYHDVQTEVSFTVVFEEEKIGNFRIDLIVNCKIVIASP